MYADLAVMGIFQLGILMLWSINCRIESCNAPMQTISQLKILLLFKFFSEPYLSGKNDVGIRKPKSNQ